MTELIEKYFEAARIRTIALKKNYDEISFKEYIYFLDETIKSDEIYGIEEGDKDSILRYVDEYMSLFVFERKKGFSIEWAKKYSYWSLQDENENAPAYAYKAVREINQDKALSDLQLFAKQSEKDELFIKHFTFLIDEDLPRSTTSIAEQSVEYSIIYKQQISKGKSQIFASHYAYLIARHEYSEFACFTEAAEYEKAILAGHSKKYSLFFAEDMSEYIANHFNNYEESLNDVLVKEERKRLEKKYQD